MTKPPEHPLSTAGLMHLLVVYIIWSSTYLAIRIVVGEGFPPFALGAARMIVAGLLLLLFAYFAKQRIKLTKRELGILSLSGILLWVGGNGLVMWAEQYANSGIAALLASSTPIWVALMDAFLTRKAPSVFFIGSLLLGFCGLGVLSLPSLTSGASTDFAAGLALLMAGLSWGIGSVVQSRNPIKVDTPVASAYQHLSSSVVFIVLSLLLQEPVPQPTSNAWFGLAYLIVFGSFFAFTSYISTLRLLPIQIAMTYAYVNPVLALLLGWYLLDEPITPSMVAGAVMVVLGVIGIFRERYSKKENSKKEQETAINA